MIKAIIGLGNPGAQYYYTRHSIGFRVLDKIADSLGSHWHEKENMILTTINISNREIFLIKPQTYMNNSGQVISYLSKKGIKSEEIIVIHDEIELPFGKVVFKTGGSAKGHNGLKSIIAACGPDFHRIRCGVSKPELKEEVSQYVLNTFSEPSNLVEEMINSAANLSLEKIKEIT